MEVDRNSVLERLGEARRFADPAASHKARLMASRGALPLPPAQIADVLFALTLDDDAEIARSARASIEKLPPNVIEAAVRGDVAPGLLALFAELFRDDPERLERIALNAATADETICFLATRPFRNIVDIVAANQIRLLRCPELLEALGQNPITSPATIDRILMFLGIDQTDPQTAVPTDDAAAVDAVEALGLDDPDTLPKELVEEPQAEAEEQKSSQNIAALIQDMSVVEKIKLARFGNGEARSVLIRDRNKVVASAAIKSPKITDTEVAAYSKARNLSEEVLRVIASNREWTRNYQVVLALTKNPKAPLGQAVKFLNRLTDRDLRTIMRSRDVPGPVSQGARRLLMRKGKV